MPKKKEVKEVKEVKEEKTEKPAESAIVKFSNVTVKLTVKDKDVRMEVL